MAKTRILVVDDEKLVRWSLEQKFAKLGYEVESAPSGEEGLSLLRDDGFDLVVLDVRLPQMDGVEVLREIRKLEREVAVVMLTADIGIARAVECVRLGAHNYLCKPFEFEEVRVAVEKALEELKLRREVTRMRDRQRRRFGLENLVGNSQSMRDIREILARIAESDAATVLVHGENGTGKELAARAIHYGSSRRDQPFMDINCSAVPETLFESELFGHERGAFTDAKTTKKGLFELADGGTLLLDEIGDMKPATQAKLLRVLETRQFRRVGGVRDISVDVRVIALTNKDLEKAVASGEFRQDLLYRLKVISVEIPPLRQRADDVPVLADFFLKTFAQEFKKSPKQIGEDAVAVLTKYRWPGNVRELRNTIERLVILEADPVIHTHHLPSDIRAGVRRGGKPRVDLPREGITLADVERDLIIQAIEHANGNQTQAAALLGIERDALRRRLLKYGLLDRSAATAGEVGGGSSGASSVSED